MTIDKLFKAWFVFGAGSTAFASKGWWGWAVAFGLLSLSCLIVSIGENLRKSIVRK